MPNMFKSQCYCTNLRRSANAITDYYDLVLKESGLTVAQYYLLINLSRIEKANITQWADNVCLDRSTMVRNVKILQTHGLIEEIAGHGKTFTLSPKGRRSLEAAIPMWNAAQEKIKNVLGKEDTGAILRIGEKIQALR